MGVLSVYQAWQEGEADAQVGAITLQQARELRSQFAEVARDLVARLPFKVAIAVRIITGDRYDVAEHIVADEDASVKTGTRTFKRKTGAALCSKALVLGDDGTLVEVKRRSPSCARCLAVAERLLEAEQEA